MTQREFFNAIAENETLTEDMRDFAKNQILLLDKRNEKRREATSRKAKENAPIIAAILETLTTDPQTAAEIAEVVEISTQKASALLRQLEEKGEILTTELKIPKKGKRKSYFIVESKEAD